MADKVRIEINRSTREAMNNTGRKGDTYDSLIIDMIRVYDMYKIAISKQRENEQ